MVALYLSELLHYNFINILFIFKGMHKFQSTVTGVSYLTEDVMLISLTAPQEFSFEAGQFIILMITNQGVTKPRSYSVLNPPSEKGKIDLCMKLVHPGFASDIFAATKLNDEFTVKGPFGNFVFFPEMEEHWFICTGTGVVPFYSMIKQHLLAYPDKQFRLVWGLRYKKDIFFKKELDLWKKNHPNFDYILTLSRDDHEYTGRVQQHLPKDLSGKTFYICGLKELVLETRELLEKKGVQKQNIKFERYS